MKRQISTLSKNAPSDLIYPAIFGVKIDFNRTQFIGKDRYLMNVDKSYEMIPILSPIQLYGNKDTRQLMNLGLRINDPNGFQVFFAYWICVRYNLYFAKVRQDDTERKGRDIIIDFSLSDVLGISLSDELSCKLNIGDNMEVHHVDNFESLNDRTSISLASTIQCSDNKEEERIDSIAFFPISSSDKMIVIGIQNKIKFA